jgi:hypothetical protein
MHAQSENGQNSKKSPTPRKLGVLGWQEAHWKDRPGYARRWHRQPFPWTTIYQFVPENGYEMLLSSTALNLDSADRQDVALNHTHFRAYVKGGYHGIAQPIPELPHHRPIRFWDFLSDEGVARVISDLELVIQPKTKKPLKNKESETVTKTGRPVPLTPQNPEKKCSNDAGFSARNSSFSVSSGLRRCLVCEKPFRARRKTKMVCSPRCRNRLWRKKVRLQGIGR